MQSLGSEYDLWVSRYLVGAGWQPPVLIEADENGSATSASVDVSPSGAAAVAWQVYAPGTSPQDYDIWANVFR